MFIRFIVGSEGECRPRREDELRTWPIHLPWKIHTPSIVNVDVTKTLFTGPTKPSTIHVITVFVGGRWEILVGGCLAIMLMKVMPPTGVLVFAQLMKGEDKAYIKEAGLLREDETNLLTNAKGEPFFMQGRVGSCHKSFIGFRVTEEERNEFGAFLHANRDRLVPDNFPLDLSKFKSAKKPKGPASRRKEPTPTTATILLPPNTRSPYPVGRDRAKAHRTASALLSSSASAVDSPPGEDLCDFFAAVKGELLSVRPTCKRSLSRDAWLGLARLDVDRLVEVTKSKALTNSDRCVALCLVDLKRSDAGSSSGGGPDPRRAKRSADAVGPPERGQASGQPEAKRPKKDVGGRGKPRTEGAKKPPPARGGGAKRKRPAEAEVAAPVGSEKSEGSGGTKQGRGKRERGAAVVPDEVPVKGEHPKPDHPLTPKDKEWVITTIVSLDSSGGVALGTFVNGLDGAKRTYAEEVLQELTKYKREYGGRSLGQLRSRRNVTKDPLRSHAMAVAIAVLEEREAALARKKADAPKDKRAAPSTKPVRGASSHTTSCKINFTMSTKAAFQ